MKARLKARPADTWTKFSFHWARLPHELGTREPWFLQPLNNTQIKGWQTSAKGWVVNISGLGLHVASVSFFKQQSLKKCMNHSSPSSDQILLTHINQVLSQLN